VNSARSNVVNLPKRATDAGPVTRKGLLLALQHHAGLVSDVDDFESLQAWSDFMFAHGAEVVALALAAIGRLEPLRRRPYVKHALGPLQQRITDLLRDGKPRTTTQMSEGLGANYNNTRKTLMVLQTRGVLRRERNALTTQYVWLLAGQALVPSVMPLAQLAQQAARPTQRPQPSRDEWVNAELIVAAFAKDNASPLPDLARECFGDATGVSIKKLKLAIHQLCVNERLERLGASSWRPIEPDNDPRRTASLDEEEDA